jgi:hypothetical protein
MRNRMLHGLLEAFAEDAGLQLAHDTANGAEVPFEVVEETTGRRRGAAFYCYRPQTADFIRSRMASLDRLPSYLPAARALAAIDGIDAYLRRRGEPRGRAGQDGRERADAVLRSFLSAVFAETSAFGHQPEAFAAAYAELEATLYEGCQVATVIAPLLGLALESDEVALGDGLSLARGEGLPDVPPEAIWSTPGEVEQGAVLAVLTVAGERIAGPPITTARTRFRRLLSALRLFESGPFALGPLAWARVDGGSWHVAPLGTAPARSRRSTLVRTAQEDELRAFCSLVARRTPRAGEVAWALRRYELARERSTPFEALTDDLLALRALLEPEGPESGRLAQRLAALCALPAERAALAERTARAVVLERAIVAGLASTEPGADLLVEELAGHLRALVRDVLCGHLDSDLRTLADELLAEAAAEPVTV